jgi:hypothetical protein
MYEAQMIRIFKNRRAVKSGSDNIGIFPLYGAGIRARQGADGSRWYRETGLSEHRRGCRSNSFSCHLGDDDGTVSSINTRISLISQWDAGRKRLRARRALGYNRALEPMGEVTGGSFMEEYYLVAKIFRGIAPAEIAVDVNAELALALNLKVANAVGLALTPEVR